MLFKSNSESADRHDSAALFCQARLIELTSITDRARGSVVNPPTDVAEEDLRNKGRAIGPTHDSPAAQIFHMIAHRSGSWEIRNDEGSKAGLFRSRQAAIKFARDESPDGQFIIIDDTTWA